jgi:hypothetical protein
MASKIIANSGTIFVASPDIGIYSDAACTLIISALAWGNLEPSSVTTKQFYVKNLGNVPMVLSSATSAWVPTNAATYIHPTWDKEATVLAVGASALSIVTLRVDATVTGITTFSSSMTITGTRQ